MKGMYEHMTKTNEQNKPKYKPVSSLTLDTNMMNGLSNLMEIHEHSIGTSQNKILEHIAKKVIAGDYIEVVKPKPNKKKRISFSTVLLDEMKKTAKQMGYEHKISQLFNDVIEYEFNKQNQINPNDNLEEIEKNRKDFKYIGL